jgi:hypothetical protein
MHAPTIFSIFALSAMGAEAAATPAVDSPMYIDGKKAPDQFAYMDITNGIPTEPFQMMNMTPAAPNSLKARKDVKTCIATSARAGVCVAIASYLTTTGFNIATQVKSSSNNHDCSVHNGHVDNVTWSTYATGNNCDTTAQASTIAGSIDKYLRAQDSNVCGVHCLKMTHGGTWTGYVTLAPQGTDLNSFYCGSSNSFGQCSSGGKNDQ